MTRLDKLHAALRDRDLDALLVTNLTNVRWLTGFTGSNGAAVVGRKDGLLHFLTDFRYLVQSETEVDPQFERDIGPDLLDLACHALPSDKTLRVGYDDRSMSVYDHKRLKKLVPSAIELVGSGGLVEKLRARKDPEELEKIRAAAKLADDALSDVLSRGLAGRKEKEVALDLEFAMRKLGAESASFPSIVASGAHGALPHAEPRDVEIPASTLVVIDWGAVLDGYASDCTRTYATGPLDPRDQEVYDVVLQAQLAAVDAVKPGPLGKEVDAVARKIISAAGHGEHFGHGLGHGVGLEVHEGPRLSKQGNEELEPGMVVTVEPGVYVPDAVGVRIEDLVFVTEDGHEIVSSLSKDLTTID